MRITTKGQVTIPIGLREKLALLPGTEVRFEEDGQGGVRVIKEPGGDRGRRIVEHMKAWGGKHLRMTTDEIMALTRGEP